MTYFGPKIFQNQNLGPGPRFCPTFFGEFPTKKLCQGWFLCKNGSKYSCFLNFSHFFEKWPKITQNRVGGPYWPPPTPEIAKKAHTR